MRGLLREMLSLSERRQPFAVCTVVDAAGSVPGKLGATMIVRADGTTRGTVGGAGLEERVKASATKALSTGTGQGLHHFDLARWKPDGLDSVCGGSVAVSIIVHRPIPHLLLLGAGHCAQALAQLAGTVEWDISVVDGRSEFADRARYPEAVEVIAKDPIEWIDRADLGPYSHAYVLGHSWETDAAVLSKLLPRFDGFVGVIGSRSKRRAIVERLRLAGVDEARIERMVCPVGVDVSAETPAEIAISIAAELVKRLREHDGSPELLASSRTRA